MTITGREAGETQRQLGHRAQGGARGAYHEGNASRAFAIPSYVGFEKELKQ